MSTATLFDDENPFGLAPSDGHPTGRNDDGRAVREMTADVTLVIDDETVTAFAEEISACDIVVATYDRPPIGTEIAIAFTLPTGVEVQGRARVGWYGPEDAGAFAALPTMGLELVAMNDDQQAAINTFVEGPRGLFGV